MKIGIQLYSVRELLQNDFQGTLHALAEMGYQGVEFAWNYGGMAPDKLKAFLDQLKLKTCGLHAPLAQLLDADSEAYRYADVLQSPYVTTSLCSEVEKDWFATIQQVAQAGLIAHSKDMMFTYHHHAQEFQTINGQIALDLLLETTDSHTVGVELDTHWIVKGGQDALAYVKKYAERGPQLHVKDVAKDGGFCPLGQGVLDFKPIIQTAQQTGTQWFIVEQDQCSGSPLDAVKTSIQYLQQLPL